MLPHLWLRAFSASAWSTPLTAHQSRNVEFTRSSNDTCPEAQNIENPLNINILVWNEASLEEGGAVIGGSMTFKAYLNRAEHTHENEQFYRVAAKIKAFVEDQGLDALLIGNPFNARYPYFRPDALLYYTYGLLLIDFKNYEGVLTPSLCPGTGFDSGKWYVHTSEDRDVEVKGGSYPNPFKQMYSYRLTFANYVLQDPVLKQYLERKNVCALNVFTGPIVLNGAIPGSVPYYRITDEASLQTFLFQFSNLNTFNPAVSAALKGLFPAPVWKETFAISSACVETPVVTSINPDTELESKDLPPAVVEFFAHPEQKTMILTSGDAEQRDDWARAIRDTAWDNGIERVEIVAHSTRICVRLGARSGEKVSSLYSLVYGGREEYVDSVLSVDDESTEDNFNATLPLRRIPIASADAFEDATLFIVQDAHLVNNAKRDPNIDLQFGSGCLINDFAEFVSKIKRSRVIFIGDACSYSFGAEKYSALGAGVVEDCFGQTPLIHVAPYENEDGSGRSILKQQLGRSIQTTGLFNRLHYEFDDTLVECPTSLCSNRVKAAFGQPLETVPSLGLLYSTHKDCLKANDWIKKVCLGQNDGHRVAVGDLLITYNDVHVPYDDLLYYRLSNGTYVTVLAIGQTKTRSIPNKSKGADVTLSFTELTVRVLTLPERPIVNVMLWNDSLKADLGDFSRDMGRALTILTNMEISCETRKGTFIGSDAYQNLLSDEDFLKLSEHDQYVVQSLALQYGKPKDQKETINTTKDIRQLVSHYYNQYRSRLAQRLRLTNPYLNAIQANYGWALTVHKAIGMQYDETILQAKSHHTQQACEDYFRYIYTGINTAARVLIGHPQAICPTRDVTCFTQSTQLSVPRTCVTFDATALNPRHAGWLDEVVDVNAKGAISQFLVYLESKGYAFTKLRCLSPYKVRVTLQAAMGSTVDVDFDYGKKGVSGIKTLRSIADPQVSREIAEARKHVFEPSHASFEGYSAGEVRARDALSATFEAWRMDLQAHDVSLREHGSKDHYCFLFDVTTSRAESGTFKATYNNAGFITKLEWIGVVPPNLKTVVEEVVLK